MTLYHRESEQEGFLVVEGECLLIVEGEERRSDPGTTSTALPAPRTPSSVRATGRGVTVTVGRRGEDGTILMARATTPRSRGIARTGYDGGERTCQARSSRPFTASVASTAGPGRGCGFAALEAARKVALAEAGHDRAGHDLREADDRDESVRPRRRGCRAGRGSGHLVGAPDLGVVVLDLARRQLAERLHLDLVDHRVEDVLARAEAHAAEDAHDHALLVLAGLVAEPDRGRLPARPELVGDERRVEVEGVHRGGESASYETRTSGRARGVSSSGEVHPSRHSASVSSSRRSSRTWRTPSSPAAARPKIGARPASTARAPSARALATSVPRRMPPSR